MRTLIDFNAGWVFHEGFDGDLTTTLAPGKPAHLPHNAVELPFSYFDETSYQRLFTYQKQFDADPTWAGKEVALVFDGAMANTVVYLNGVEVAAHKDGYTPFVARLTGRLKPGSQPRHRRA
jgi:beta-galactosidase